MNHFGTNESSDEPINESYSVEELPLDEVIDITDLNILAIERYDINICVDMCNL